MSISKLMVMCCALIGVHSVSAQPVENLDGRIVLQYNSLSGFDRKADSSVPPDPYKKLEQNLADDKTINGELSVPPDPYLTILHNPPMFRTGGSNAAHNPPMY